MIQRARAREAVEVGDAGGDGGPVGDVEQRSQRFAGSGGEGGGIHDRGGDQDDQEHQDHGRQQPPGPSEPEVLQVQVSGPIPGGEQDRGDQEAAQGEEDPDPQEAAGHPRRTQVVGDDGRHGNGANTIEPWQIRCFMDQPDVACVSLSYERIVFGGQEIRGKAMPGAPAFARALRLTIGADQGISMDLRVRSVASVRRPARKARIMRTPVSRCVGELSDYAEAVLAAVDQVPSGRVASYGDIAEFVGAGGPRQVGHVMARHGGAVAWWRVVRADGRPAAGLEAEAAGSPAVRGAADPGRSGRSATGAVEVRGANRDRLRVGDPA